MRLCYDAVNPANLPAGADLYAGYDDGSYNDVAAIKARFPGKTVIAITVFPRDDIGEVLDVENGDATPAQAPGWVVARRNAGLANPGVYCSLSAWPTVRAAFTAAQVAPPWYWIASYPGNGAELYPGSLGHQYVDMGGYDISVMADEIPGIDPIPVPPVYPTVVFPPVPVPAQEPLMNVRFQTTTGADGTAYVQIPVPAGTTQICACSVDVLADDASSPPKHDVDLGSSALGKSGVVCEPAVGGPHLPGNQLVRIAGGAPNHFYTGAAVFA